MNLECYIVLQKKIMDELYEEDQNLEITVKRPFLPKFIKQLNFQQNERNRKSKKRQKSQTKITEQNLDKLSNNDSILQHKSSKRLQEVVRNGNRIIANWKNDQINGEAEIFYSNGVTFKGVYQNGVKVKGHFKFLNGYEYVGNCLGNKFYGEGSLIFPSGKTITGNWKEYSVIGNGKIQYPHGEVYYGQINNFKKNGKGYLYLNDNTKYIGEFKDGLINGNGTYYVNDQPISKGEWQNGELIKSEGICQTNESTIIIGQIQDKASTIQKQVKKTAKNNKDNNAHPTSIGDFLGIDQQNKKRKTVKFLA